MKRNVKTDIKKKPAARVPKKRYTVEQRVAILKDAVSMSNREVMSKYNITPTTLWKWRKLHVDVIGGRVSRPRGLPDRASIVVPCVESMRQLVETQKMNSKSKRVRKDVLRQHNEMLKTMVHGLTVELSRLRAPQDSEQHA